MTDVRWLSRVRLGSAASVKALLPLLQRDTGPGGTGSVDVDRRLIWSLFADGPDRSRDFLWRRMEDGAFLVLSERRPEDRHGLFEIDEPKAFAPPWLRATGCDSHCAPILPCEIPRNRTDAMRPGTTLSWMRFIRCPTVRALSAARPPSGKRVSIGSPGKAARPDSGYGRMSCYAKVIANIASTVAATNPPCRSRP